MTHLQVQNGTEILDINIISVDNRCVSFVVNDDLSVSMKVPVGMSREMAEKYVRINEDRIWREYEWRKSEIIRLSRLLWSWKTGVFSITAGLCCRFSEIWIWSCGSNISLRGRHGFICGRETGGRTDSYYPDR